MKNKIKRTDKIFSFFLLLLIAFVVNLTSRAQNINDSNNTSPADTVPLVFSENKALPADTVSVFSKKTKGPKFLRASLFATEYNLVIGTSLAVGPETVSKWEDKMEKLKLKAIAKQYTKSFTTPPVIDKDLFIINYIGHPYQGSFYYNSLRSQNACAFHASLFCLGHSLLWEYGWEAGLEQPSIQDLVSTPFAGILVGELTHRATLKMSENGFCWYEVVLVYILNPAYVINNGFKLKKASKK